MKMRKQQGATLIEVLISVLVLAVGLLGVAATQTLSLKNGNGANQRYMAALAAQEIVERMRANPSGLEQGSYDGEVDGSETRKTCTTACSVNDLASMDLYEWGQLLQTNLPASTGTIERNGDEVIVTVAWKLQHTGENYGSTDGGAEDADFTMTVEL
ncbi:type IV pilus modification protein PilV [Microbulbifer elongatus]|uniref:Type IV pilus modification protein PilV n=1 Tax=Microbulbifer elongatus TaxID=86173 RepID=A0ABT1P3T2_9GAMM|nr:type IV pilus modification protein PilV [Microbulbifer elongatus]MCQ3830772.1 type IV pilus modification protein PilV [Microbulbifer elongatus]